MRRIIVLSFIWIVSALIGCEGRPTHVGQLRGRRGLHCRWSMCTPSCRTGPDTGRTDMMSSPTADMTVDAQPMTDASLPVDGDDDGIPDTLDNCPEIPNPAQEDSDEDNIGDAAMRTPLLTPIQTAYLTLRIIVHIKCKPRRRRWRWH